MQTKPEVLALIPARGGSKSVPRKNLLQVGGQPLLAYSIQHALACPAITRTVVSTDDAEIAEVAKRFGAEVPFLRPARFATDLAVDLDVFRHALEWFAREQDYRPELVVQLRPTSPVRSPQRIEEAIAAMLAQPAADALRSVSLAEQTPYKMWCVAEGWLRPVLSLPGVPEAHSMPRQELPRVYHQNGYVDVIRPRTILELGSMTGTAVLPFVMDGPTHDLDYADQVPAIERALVSSDDGGSAPRAARVPH